MGILYKVFEKGYYEAVKQANKEGMEYLRYELKEKVIDKDQFNIKLYGTTNEDKIKKIRKTFL